MILIIVWFYEIDIFYLFSTSCFPELSWSSLKFFRDQPATQMIAVEVLHLVLSAAAENLDSAQKSKRRELGIPANREPPSDLPTELPLLGEGGSDGLIEPGKSVSFASLEVCLCILVRLPAIHLKREWHWIEIQF